MKIRTEVQYQTHNVLTSDVEKTAKEAIKAEGIKLNSLESLEVYYQPETQSVFYAATAKDGTVISNEEALNIN